MRLFYYAGSSDKWRFSILVDVNRNLSAEWLILGIYCGIYHTAMATDAWWYGAYSHASIKADY